MLFRCSTALEVELSDRTTTCDFKSMPSLPDSLCSPCTPTHVLAPPTDLNHDCDSQIVHESL